MPDGSYETGPVTPNIEISPRVYNFASKFEVDSPAISEYLLNRGLSEEEVAATSIKFVPRLKRIRLTSGSYGNDISKIRTTYPLPRAVRSFLSRRKFQNDSASFEHFNTVLSRNINETVQHELEHRIQDRPLGILKSIQWWEKLARLKELGNDVARDAAIFVGAMAIVGATLETLGASNEVMRTASTVGAIAMLWNVSRSKDRHLYKALPHEAEAREASKDPPPWINIELIGTPDKS